MIESPDFWAQLDALVDSCPLVIDRPKGTSHPRYPEFTYPLDYGYLEGTSAADGGGIDVWVGSLPERRVTAVVCTLDSQQCDLEIKLLVGCTPEEAHQVLAIHNRGEQSAKLIAR